MGNDLDVEELLRVLPDFPSLKTVLIDNSLSRTINVCKAITAKLNDALQARGDAVWQCRTCRWTFCASCATPEAKFPNEHNVIMTSSIWKKQADTVLGQKIQERKPGSATNMSTTCHSC